MPLIAFAGSNDFKRSSKSSRSFDVSSDNSDSLESAEHDAAKQEEQGSEDTTGRFHRHLFGADVTSMKSSACYVRRM